MNAADASPRAPSLRRWALIILACALAPATGSRVWAAEQVQTEFVSVNLDIAEEEPTLDERRLAERHARERAVEAALANPAYRELKQSFDEHLLMAEILRDANRYFPELTVTASRVMHGQLQIKASVKVNVPAIGDLVRSYSRRGISAIKDQGTFVMYIAREAHAVIEYKDKETDRTQHTAESAVDSDISSTTTTTVTGGSIERKRDALRYRPIGTEILVSDGGRAFEERGLAIYESAELDLNQELMDKIPHYWAEEDKFPSAELVALREELKNMGGIRFFVLIWLDAGEVTRDPDLDRMSSVVKASAQAWDLNQPGRAGRSMARTEAFMAQGFGQNQTVAQEVAMKRAVQEVAARITNAMISAVSK